MEKDIKQAAQYAVDGIEMLLPPMDYYEESENAGRHHALNEYGLDLFKAGAEWALEMLWSDPAEIPDVCQAILIKSNDKIRMCSKNGDYIEDRADGLPLLEGEVDSFIDSESLFRKLNEGLW